jgi:hypothetical protein
LITDIANLQSTAQIAAAQADDLIHFTEAKLKTLALVLARIMSSQGDTGLMCVNNQVEELEDILEVAGKIPLTTPLCFPRHLNATAMWVIDEEYEWTTEFKDSMFSYTPAPSKSDELQTRSTSPSRLPDHQHSRSAQGSNFEDQEFLQDVLHQLPANNSEAAGDEDNDDDEDKSSTPNLNPSPSASQVWDLSNKATSGLRWWSFSSGSGDLDVLFLSYLLPSFTTTGASCEVYQHTFSHHMHLGIAPLFILYLASK